MESKRRLETTFQIGAKTQRASRDGVTSRFVNMLRRDRQAWFVAVP
jgi:hypothetical protein